MQIFTRPYIMMERGGPDNSALFYTIYIFQNAFRYSRMGYASAMAWTLFVAIVFLTWLGSKSASGKIHYEGR
jgi:multiple sugar transport system permease protein